MLQIPSAFGTWTMAVISDVKLGSFEGNPVANFRAAIVTGLVGKKITDNQGNEIYAQVEAQNYFDVAVWDADMIESAKSLVKGQKVEIDPRSITATKPYEGKDGVTRANVKLTVAKLVPGALPTRRAATAPSAASSQFDEAELDGVPF